MRFRLLDQKEHSPSIRILGSERRRVNMRVGASALSLYIYIYIYRVHAQENGAPQGGVLSFTLFIVKMKSFCTGIATNRPAVEGTLLLGHHG